MALRETFLRADLEPRVATTLVQGVVSAGGTVDEGDWGGEEGMAYQTVATPYLREVRTMEKLVARVWMWVGWNGDTFV